MPYHHFAQVGESLASQPVVQSSRIMTILAQAPKTEEGVPCDVDVSTIIKRFHR
jgi:hypothetical protein